MKKILEILNSSFLIDKIIINNFTVFNEHVSIEMVLKSDFNDIYKLLFKVVQNLNIDSDYYACSYKSNITIEDISQFQLENVFYKVCISEEILTFYCKEIVLLENV